MAMYIATVISFGKTVSSDMVFVISNSQSTFLPEIKAQLEHQINLPAIAIDCSTDEEIELEDLEPIKKVVASIMPAPNDMRLRVHEHIEVEVRFDSDGQSLYRPA